MADGFAEKAMDFLEIKHDQTQLEHLWITSLSNKSNKCLEDT